MDQRGGGIRFTVPVDRRLCVEGTRFALRTLPALRRQVWVGVGFGVLATIMAGLTTLGSLEDGEALGPAVASAAPLWLFVVLLIVLGSSAVRARVLASQTLRDLPAEMEVAYRFDENGYEAHGAGITTRLEWPIVTAVVEGDRFIVLGAGRRFMVCPAERLTLAERATIRRWAEAASGERTWKERRSSRPERLRVTPSTPGGPASVPAPGVD